MFHVEARRAITRPEIRDRLRVAYGTAAAGSRATVVERFAERITPQELKSPRYTPGQLDRKSTRLNSSHTVISYAVFCLKKKTVGRVAENDARGVPIVGHPVRLEPDQRIGDDRAVEKPIDIRGVERVDDVADPMRPTSLE